MTLADTAALVSSLELQDKFTPTVNKYEKSLGGLEKSTNSLHATTFKVGQDIGTGINKTVKNIEKVALAGGAFLVSQIKFGIDSIKALEDVTAQTNAVIRSTKGAAGESAQAIADLANKYEDLNATLDNKVIQSGENVLLTFTNIGKKAFEPALKAALDLNQAMGGGENGLQGTMIQLGKALNDPVKGITALTRVGVTFSDQQKKQIKDLVKHNNLYGAQKVILAELSKEFGGSFAAAGQTATGKFAKLGDAVEDLQASLATALLPALVDVAVELDKFLRDPATINAVKTFGQGLAKGFKDAVAWAKTLDWKGIGDAIKTAAGAAKGLVDAFAHAPAWLQQAVVTGWGLNKLTGGALTNIIGDVAGGLGNQLLARGSSAANPVYVSQVGVGGTGTGGGAKGLLVSAAAALGIGIAIDKFVELQNQQGFIAGQTNDIGTNVTNSLTSSSVADLQAKFKVLSDGLEQLSGTANSAGPLKDLLYGGQIQSLTNDLTAVATELKRRSAGGSGSPDDRDAAHAAAQSLQDVKDASQGTAAEIIAMGKATLNSTSALKSITKDQSWLKNLKTGIAARSAAKYGNGGLGEGAVSATYQRDVLGRMRSIDKSGASSEAKLERMKALLKGAKDATDQTKRTLSADIKTLTTKVKNQKPPSVTVNVGTNVEVSANSVVAKFKQTRSFGPPDPDHKHGGNIL